MLGHRDLDPAKLCIFQFKVLSYEARIPIDGARWNLLDSSVSGLDSNKETDAKERTDTSVL